MTKANQLPLRCRVKDGALRFEIGVEVLKFAAERHPEFWDGWSGEDTPNIIVTNARAFAREVERALNREEEDGSTLLSKMIDLAIVDAVGDGCEGVDHEAMDKRQRSAPR